METQKVLYDNLLNTIYNSSKLTSKISDYDKFESTRRFLDVTRLIHRQFGPLTVYINENEGCNLECILFDGMNFKMQDHNELLSSVIYEYVKLIKSFKNDTYNSLLKLSLKFREFTDLVEELKKEDKSNDEELSLLFSLNYYYRASAPSFLYKGLK